MSRSNQRQMKNSGKSGVKIIFVGILLLLGIIVGFLGYRYYQTQQMAQTGKDTVNGFLTSIKKGKYEDVTKYLSQESVEKLGLKETEIAEKYQNIFTGIGVHDIKINKLELTDHKFSYELSMKTHLGELALQKYQGTLTSDNRQIDWAPNLIFPQMGLGDKVSYQFIPANRGQIFDRNGSGLAINGTVYQLGVVPKELGSETKAERIKGIAAALDMTEEAINAALDQSWVQEDYFVPLKKVTELAEGFQAPTGLVVQETTGRTYPLKEAAAQLIGYVGSVMAEDIEKNSALPAEGIIGRVGLERAYDKELRGSDGGTIVITDKNDIPKETLQEIEVKHGTDFKLTLDGQVQYLAYQSLMGKPGSSVVSEPKSGDLLALASSPSFDPNKMTNGISQADYDVYANDVNQPFMARFATGYAPGSTFKMVTGAIGLENGTIDPAAAVEIAGLKWQKDGSWGDYLVTRVRDESPVDLRGALVYSDNIYFAQKTLAMGEKAFREGLNKFIFGEELDLPIAMEPAQISTEAQFGSEILLADTGYGQGQLLLNPIQQLTTYSVFPNNGTLVYPKLRLDAETKVKGDVVAPQAAATISEDLQAVVTDPKGAAHSLSSLGLNLAAKTGTAEIKTTQDQRGKQNSFLYVYDATGQKYAVMQFWEDHPDGQSAVQMVPELLTYLAQHYQ